MTSGKPGFPPEWLDPDRLKGEHRVSTGRTFLRGTASGWPQGQRKHRPVGFEADSPNTAKEMEMDGACLDVVKMLDIFLLTPRPCHVFLGMPGAKTVSADCSD